MSNSGLSPAAPIGEEKPLQMNDGWGTCLCHQIIVDSQVSGLCTPFSSKRFQHMASSSCQEEDIVIHNGWTPEEKEKNIIYITNTLH